MEVIVAAVVVALVAAFVQGTVGFGFGLVSMALLPIWLPIELAVPVVAMYCLVVNGSLLVQLRRHVRARNAAPLLIGALIGIPIGVAFLRSAPPSALRLVLGAILLFYVGMTVYRRRSGRAPLEAPRLWGYAAGLAAGVLGAAFNTGGPPAVLYVAAQPQWRPEEVKANLQALFVLTTVVQLGLFTATGLIDASVLRLAAIGMPAGLLGAWLGHRASARLDRDRFQLVLQIALAILGASYVLRAMFSD